MSYDISFKVKVEGVDMYISAGHAHANITWSLREMIKQSTGLEWKEDTNNGLVKDVIPSIQKGLLELKRYPKKYKQYESPDGWGTIEGCKNFFTQILMAWEDFCTDFETNRLIDVVTFWIG